MNIDTARNNLKAAWPADFGSNFDLEAANPRATVTRGEVIGIVSAGRGQTDPPGSLFGWRFQVIRNGRSTAGWVGSAEDAVKHVRQLLD